MRKFNTALTFVTFVTAVSWGVTLASIWMNVDARALPVIRVTAATSAVGVMLLCSVRWLGGRGMVYLLDAMLTQRARYRGRHAQPAHLRAAR